MKNITSIGLITILLLSSTGGLSQCVYGLPTQQAADMVKQKLLTQNVRSGITYLVKVQNSDGSWNQGEESQYMRSAGEQNNDLPNVADTCMAALALVRAGNLPNSGDYAKNVTEATQYICSQIEDSDKDSLFITNVRGTRVQTKLGQYIDTFMASVFLPEVKGYMSDIKGNQRVAEALDKVIYKIEKNQGQNGIWASNGWAPIHSQSLAMQGLNKAKQAGSKVSEMVLKRAELYAKSNFDNKTSAFGTYGSAGIKLYSAGATLGGLQSAINTANQQKPEIEKIANDATVPKEARLKAKLQLKNYRDNELSQQQAIEAVNKQLNDDRFINGFGCNGGEEFLSYLQISETLLANKNSNWHDWDKKITANINRVQNQDGSWMGQHCITSRTFCTAAALLVLMADRSPVAKGIPSGKA